MHAVRFSTSKLLVIYIEILSRSSFNLDHKHCKEPLRIRNQCYINLFIVIIIIYKK